MASQTWVWPSSPTEYQPVGSLNCLPLFSYFPGLVEYPTGTGIDFIANTGGLSHANPATAYRGVYAGYPIVPYPNDIGLQTYFGPYPPTSSSLSNNGQIAAYHRDYGMSQDAALNDWVPFASMTGQQLVAGYHSAVDHRRRQPFKFGHYLQPFQGIIDCGDSRAIDAEVRKLKEVWRVGVGIKKRHRNDRKDKKEEHSQDEITQIPSGKEPRRSLCTEEPLSVNSETPAGGIVHERMREEKFGLGQDTPIKSSAIPSSFRNSIITDSLDEVIKALEEFERIELLPSPEVTPVRTESTSKNTTDKKPTMTGKVEHPPLVFGPEYKKRESPASRLPIPKETPNLKSKASSSSITKGVTSLRPPRTISKSSKPVTQPIPFKLVGETVSRKLRLKREQRRQSAGDQA